MTPQRQTLPDIATLEEKLKFVRSLQYLDVKTGFSDVKILYSCILYLKKFLYSCIRIFHRSD